MDVVAARDARKAIRSKRRLKVFKVLARRESATPAHVLLELNGNLKTATDRTKSGVVYAALRDFVSKGIATRIEPKGYYALTDRGKEFAKAMNV